MIVVIMGVTGSGKTTVGSLLAKQLGWKFFDADDFHSAANKEKMRRGIGLDDADRAPWLEAMHTAMLGWEADGENAVLACSALKRAYRKLLRQGVSTRFFYLRGTAELIVQRLQHRSGHYATVGLVASQLADLEEPRDAEVVDISTTPEEIAAEIRRRLASDIVPPIETS
jgi:gluconokinase